MERNIRDLIWGTVWACSWRVWGNNYR